VIGGIDQPTLVAIALAAYAIANIAHEGVGHGGACLAVGGSPEVVSAVHFECDVEGLPGTARKWLAAGGTLVNLALGSGAFVLLGFGLGAASFRYFLWLFGTLNLLQGSGYWLFSGIGSVGDWAHVIDGWTPAWAWRLGLTVLGGAAYWSTIVFSLRRLLPFLGGDDARLARAATLTVIPYLAGGLLYVLAVLPNPHGFILVMISAAAASFGGASALAWMTQMLRDSNAWPPALTTPLALPRSGAWLALSALLAIAFVFVLGPSVRL